MIGKILTNKNTGEVIHVTGEEGKGTAKLYNLNYVYSKTNKQPFLISQNDLDRMLVYDTWKVG